MYPRRPHAYGLTDRQPTPTWVASLSSTYCGSAGCSSDPSRSSEATAATAAAAATATFAIVASDVRGGLRRIHQLNLEGGRSHRRRPRPQSSQCRSSCCCFPAPQTSATAAVVTVSEGRPPPPPSRAAADAVTDVQLGVEAFLTQRQVALLRINGDGGDTAGSADKDRVPTTSADIAPLSLSAAAATFAAAASPLATPHGLLPSRRR